ncbi:MULTISPECIES: phosphate regulon transcriptional regulator PhoB [unclassified Aminobacter]|uniref:phosphate regulon transcriptional regulator PhoB n=1 Tax=unclassified Aminobacter TaxID=2644704 RepID=UPI0004AE9674|nr:MULTISPECIES: phosphate regulon transcriptional regulator PhoB [unclassified Aminobacter]TWG67342.1 two-component system phosphate regulon response regulator PhoB [Aminobacter sp. J44]TWH28625.1 two-component system phosphate regulon response regulator PhoB [Aminobacter sp. J15]
MIAPKIMVVEDEEALGILLRYNLEAEGYQVEVVTRGDEAEMRLREHVPDLLVLDWMVPAVSGIELCRRLRLRPETERLPVIMLTARGEESDRVRGLSTGADDYLVKPFSTPEFIARVRALLRRAKPEVLSSVLKVGDIVLDRETHRVHRGDTEIRLGPTEFRLLEFMMRHPGRVFSRSQLLDNVWGETIYIDERTVDVHVGRLRKAVNRDGETDIIRTIRGAGYAMQEG